MDFLSRSDRVHWFRLSVMGGLVTLAGAALFAVFHPHVLSGEAFVYEESARQLIGNTTLGRQALISSLWWPPFCTLVRLPLVFMIPDDGFPWASIALSGVSGFFVLAWLWRSSRPLAGSARALLVCAVLAVSPFFAAELVSGSSGLLIVLLVVVTADSLARWLVGRSVRSLVYFAVAAALLVGMSPEITVWLVMVMVLFTVDLIMSRSMSRRQKEAVMILGMLPWVYTLGLWFLMNWLIMGDALYFLKPLWKVYLLPSLEEGGQDELNILHFVCGLVPAFTAGISAGARNRTGLLWSLFAVLLFISVLIFRHVGMLWQDSHILKALPVLVCFTAVAAMGHLDPSRPAGRRQLLLLFPLILACLSYAVADSAGKNNSADHEAELLSSIERRVIGRSRYAKVFVCGYDSFRFLREEPSSVFEHSLDFNFNKAKNDYKGHHLFVMVKKPSGRSSGDSIHWKYVDIFTLGGEETLYDGDWGDWRLFEIVQAVEGEGVK